jgi:hypothetical protein
MEVAYMKRRVLEISSCREIIVARGNPFVIFHVPFALTGQAMQSMTDFRANAYNQSIGPKRPQEAEV